MFNPNDDSFLLLPTELLIKITSYLTIRQLVILVMATIKNKRANDFKAILAMRKNVILNEPKWTLSELQFLFSISKADKVVIYPNISNKKKKIQKGMQFIPHTLTSIKFLYYSMQFQITSNPLTPNFIPKDFQNVVDKVRKSQTKNNIYSETVKELIIMGPYHKHDRAFNFPNVQQLTLSQSLYPLEWDYTIRLMLLFPKLQHFKISIAAAKAHAFLFAQVLKLDSLIYIEPTDDHNKIKVLPYADDMIIRSRSKEEMFEKYITYKFEICRIYELSDHDNIVLKI